MDEQAGWLWTLWAISASVTVARVISCATDQTKMTPRPQNSLPIALHLCNCTCCLAASLGPATESCVTILYVLPCLYTLT